MNRYNSYKDAEIDWVDIIPTHWKKSKLKYVSEIITGNTPSKNNDENYINGKYLWIKPDGLNGFKPTNDCKEWISDIGLSETRIVPPLSVLLNGIGNIGKFGYSEFASSTNQQIHSVVFNNDVNNKFGLYLISNLTDEMNKNSEKVVISIYTKTKLSNLDIILPPLHEQEQIVAYLDKKTAIVDTLISSKEKKINILKEKRTALINHVITKGLDPKVKLKDSGVEWIGEIPAHWEIKKLRYLGECQNGISIGAEFFGTGFPFVSYGDVYKNEILPNNVTGLVDSSEIERERFSVCKGDVFFTRTSETIKEIGIASVCNSTIENSTFAGFLIRFRPTINSIFNGFSRYIFSSYIPRIYFVKEMNLVTRASLSQELLKRLPVLLPPFDEQIEISNFLDTHTQEIDELISLEQKKIVTLKEYRQALISEVVTGKIKVIKD
jgi:type I restriction enzyme S subunit